MKAARWVKKEIDCVFAERLGEAFSLPGPAARILASRLESIEEADGFLHAQLKDLPDPYLMADVEKAASRISEAVKHREKTVVWGDYDVDGITSASLFLSFFRSIGFMQAEYRIPQRLGHGYGLSVEDVDRLADEGVRLLITVDNGITSLEEARKAKERGVDLVVVDHHQLAESLPEALAVVDPQRPDCNYPDKFLCAAGVVLVVLQGVRRALVDNGLLKMHELPPLASLLELAALATVADLVPLKNVNRLWVRTGLKQMATTRRVGLMALKEVCKIEPLHEVGTYHAGFLMGPRINAAGRLDDPAQAVELLLTQDLDEARSIANRLDRLNCARQKLEQETLEQAQHKLDETGWDESRPAIVLYGEDWHEGVIGIVASRLVDLHHRPCILLAGAGDGLARGSARSIDGLHIKQALDDCADLLERYGGHRMAAGMTLRTERIEEFSEKFLQICGDTLTEDHFRATLRVDDEMDFAELDERFVTVLDGFAPFGMGNPQPNFLTKNAYVHSARVLKDAHLKLVLGEREPRREFKAIGFNLATKYDVKHGQRWDIVYTPRWSEWGGQRYVELSIKDMRPSEES